MSQKCKLSKKCSPGEIWTAFRSRRSQIFFKMGVLKIFANPKRKRLCWRHFFKKLQSWRLLKRDFNAGAFLWNLQNILTEQLQWLLLTFNSYFQRIPERKRVRLLAINIRFNWKKVFAVAKISTSVRKIIPEFIYPFFSVLSFLNFAMKK